MSGSDDDALRRLVTEGRDKFVREALTKLAAGGQDREAAIGLLMDFRNSATLHPEVFDWLWEAFGRVIAGEDANAALGLKQPASRPRGTDIVDKMAIAAFLELRRRENMPQAEARRAAKEYFAPCTARTIGNADRAVKLPPDLDSRLLQHLSIQGRRAKKGN